MSTSKQWLEVANRLYRGKPDLLLLEIDEKRLKSQVKYEPNDGDIYPHLYGKLNVDAVVNVHPLRALPDGSFGPL